MDVESTLGKVIKYVKEIEKGYDKVRTENKHLIEYLQHKNLLNDFMEFQKNFDN
jgi:hypothetical protein